MPVTYPGDPNQPYRQPYQAPQPYGQPSYVPPAPPAGGQQGLKWALVGGAAFLVLVALTVCGYFTFLKVFVHTPTKELYVADGLVSGRVMVKKGLSGDETLVGDPPADLVSGERVRIKE